MRAWDECPSVGTTHVHRQVQHAAGAVALPHYYTDRYRHVQMNHIPTLRSAAAALTPAAAEDSPYRFLHAAMFHSPPVPYPRTSSY